MNVDDILDDPDALDAEVKRYRKHLKREARKRRRQFADASTPSASASPLAFHAWTRVPTFSDWETATLAARKRSDEWFQETAEWRNLVTDILVRCGTGNMPEPPDVLMRAVVPSDPFDPDPTPGEFWTTLLQDRFGDGR